MQQPELGVRLTALRREKNLTQEELVERSRVSVRTIQRIEAGEVTPRMSTVKILLEALGVNPETFIQKPNEIMEQQQVQEPIANRNTLIVAALAGMVYLITQIIVGALDVAWMIGDGDWTTTLNGAYIVLTGVMLIAYILFTRGFLVLASLFENTLLKLAVYMLVVVMVGKGVLDVVTLRATDAESLWLPYAGASVTLGAVSIIFGVALIRLQDGMGEMSRIAGLLEIVTGCLLITVVLFFLAFVTFIPAAILEILVLYRGYEYLSQKPAMQR